MNLKTAFILASTVGAIALLLWYLQKQGVIQPPSVVTLPTAANATLELPSDVTRIDAPLYQTAALKSPSQIFAPGVYYV